MPVAVIGAGIVGLTSAVALQNKGYDVTVFEAADHPAMGASYGNAGLIAAASAEAWSSPAAILAALKWIGRDDAPLKVHLAWDWERLRWLSKFAWSALSYQTNTKALAELSLAARGPLQKMAQDAAADFDFVRGGVLDLYGTQADRKTAERVVGWMGQVGVPRTFVEPETLRQLEPTLPPSWAFATHSAEDFTGDSKAFCEALVTWLQTQGATLAFGRTVMQLIPKDRGVLVVDQEGCHGFDQVVVANGLGAGQLSKPLGDRLDIYGVKGYSLTLNLTKAQAALAPRHGLLDHEAKIAVSTLGHRLRVAGTAEIGAKDLALSPARLRPLYQWVQGTLPDLADAPAEEWAGFRPMRAQIQPLLKPSRASDRILYNVGHGHLGWTFAAATAENLMAFF